MTHTPAATSSPLPLATLAGLVIVAMLAGCGRSDATAPTQVAARVNDSEISIHQINNVLQRQPGLKPEQTEAASRQVLERLVDQELAIQKAKELKLDREPRVMQAIEAARGEIIARAYAERTAERAAKPTPDDIQALYDSKPALYKERRVYTVQELLVQGTPEQIAGLREVVQQAKSLQEVSKYLQDAKLPARGSQNTVTPESMPPAAAEQFAKMKAGQAMLLPAPGGARIVVLANAQPAPATLEQARPRLEQALLAERRKQAVETDIKALRDAGKIQYLGKFAEPAASAPIAAAAPATAASAADTLDTGVVDKGLAGLK